MTLFSTLRSERSATLQKEAIQQFITFRLREEWFALPILTVQKVIPLEKVYGDPQGTGVSFTNYRDQQIMVVDVGKRIFGEKTISLPTLDEYDIFSQFHEEEQRYLLIIHQEDQDMIGLPIDSQPAIRRVFSSAFKPLPQGYLALGNIQCISSQIIEIPDHPPIFILEHQQLNLNNK
jgi:purine-binding chemotaxis protein CheW